MLRTRTSATLTLKQTANKGDIHLAYSKQLKVKRTKKWQGLRLHDIPPNRSVQMQKLCGLHTRGHTLPWQDSRQLLFSVFAWE